MKRVIGLMMLTLSISMIGCQKAPDQARVTATGARSGGLPPGSTTTASGIQLNGIVTTDPQYQSAFQQAVKDFLEAQIDPDYVGTVSCQGANQTGVLVGGKIELANGQALPVNSGQSIGKIDILPTSELLVVVYDKFQDQQNLGAIPPTYLKTATGYVQGNQVFITFSDNYGTITLQGTYDRNNAVLQFQYDTRVTFDGQRGYRGVMGDLHIPTCQFFRCQ